MKLSIAFPTFNRCAYLKRAVESVVMQLASLPPGCEIDISIHDNCSSDGTRDYGEELARTLPFVEYHRNLSNLGGDRNIALSLAHARGDYLWVFGDDDYLLPGTLKNVCAVLRSGGISLLKLATLEERDCGDLAKSPSLAGLRRVSEPAAELLRFENPDAVLETFGLGMGNFSSLIIGRDFYRRFNKPADGELFQSGYSQLAWFYEGIFHCGASFAYFKSPVLILRIELNPQGVSGDRVSRGLDALDAILASIGYDRGSIARFLRSTRNAIVVGRIKARKIAAQSVANELFAAFRAVSGIESKLKLLVIGLMPAAMYKKVWLSL